MTDIHHYCEDCRWYISRAPLNNLCGYPRPTKREQFVRRDLPPTTRFCSSERNHEGADSCGMAAKWFEPRRAKVEGWE